MKKVFLATVLLFSLFVQYGFAQTDGVIMLSGMIGGRSRAETVESQKAAPGAEQKMVSREQTMGTVTDMMNQMNGMMGKISGMMKDMPADKTKAMGEMMRDMATQMMTLSNILAKGAASETEMMMTKTRMSAMQKKMADLEKK